MNTLFAEDHAHVDDIVSIPGNRAAERVDDLDWEHLSQTLDERGRAVLLGVLTPEECMTVAALYSKDSIFRSRVVMGRHGFGRGEYKYFSYPLPAVVQQLRTSLYARLVSVANHWNTVMGINVRYPDEHESFVRRCHEAGQE